MISELRERLTTLARSATALERSLADTRRIPALDLARTLVEVDKLATRLARVENLLARSAGGSGP